MSRPIRKIAATVSDASNCDSEVSPPDWTGFQKRTGLELPSELRQQLLDSVRVGVLLIEAEHSEVDARSVAAQIRLIRKNIETEHILALVDKISSIELADRDLQHASNLLDGILGGPGAFLFALSRQQYEAIDQACRQVLVDLSALSGRQRGLAWRAWVLDVAELVESHGIRAGIRNDSAEDNTPFVRLIAELQKVYPEGHRRSVQSLEALAKEIQRAKLDYTKARLA